jgi:hypothetical protein
MLSQDALKQTHGDGVKVGGVGVNVGGAGVNVGGAKYGGVTGHV